MRPWSWNGPAAPRSRRGCNRSLASGHGSTVRRPFGTVALLAPAPPAPTSRASTRQKEWRN